MTSLFSNYHCTICKSKLLNGTETSFRRALIPNNVVSLLLKKELWVGTKKQSGTGWAGLVGGNYFYIHLKTNP